MEQGCKGSATPPKRDGKATKCAVGWLDISLGARCREFESPHSDQNPSKSYDFDGLFVIMGQIIDEYWRVSGGLIAFLKTKSEQGVFQPCPCSQYLIFSSPNGKLLGCRLLCHTVIHKPAKCKNTPNQCCCNDHLHNHSDSCFRLINEWSCSDGTDCRAAKNDPLKVRQMDRTAADN